jgi:hypothetical protein
VTPLLARVHLPYFIDGERLLVGVAMDQHRPAALGSGNGAAGGGGPPGHLLFGGLDALASPDADLGHDPGDRGCITGWSSIGAWRMTRALR